MAQQEVYGHKSTTSQHLVALSLILYTLIQVENFNSNPQILNYLQQNQMHSIYVTNNDPYRQADLFKLNFD
jgi:hypothetical protein